MCYCDQNCEQGDCWPGKGTEKPTVLDNLKNYVNSRITFLEDAGLPADEEQEKSWLECSKRDCLDWGNNQGEYNSLIEIRKILNGEHNL